MQAYKVLTSDLRSPIQGGEPVFDGRTPFELPRVEVDTSDEECGEGWNACREPATALLIGGLWPHGRPSRLFVVETSDPVVERGNKVRAATWTITEEVTDVTPHVETLTREVLKAGELTAGLVAEQMAWREALARPQRDEEAVEDGLKLVLETRGMDWSLRRFESVEDAWDARAGKGAGALWAAWDAWVADPIMGARATWAARDASASWDAGVAWDAKGAGAVWATWAAKDACVVWYASQRGWVKHRKDLISRGLREAYRHGLEIAVPTGPRELGWEMEPRPGARR